MTVSQALAEGGAALAAAGIETSGLDASLLLAAVLKTSRSSLLASGSQPLTEETLAAFNNMLKRRLAGECAAYIVGKKEFYGLEFAVDHSVLVPRPDTELLVETAIQLANNNPLRMLDLCTGSGAVAITLKHEIPEWEVWATDISASALTVAAANAARLLPPNSITFCQGDLYEALSPLFTARFSLIVSNPPYIPTAEISGLSPEVRAEPVLALNGGNDGLDIIRRIISHAPLCLDPGGVLLLEADPRQMQSIAALLDQAGFIDVQIYKDLSGNERVIGGRKR